MCDSVWHSMVAQVTLLKLCYNLHLTGLASANKGRLVAALETALMNNNKLGDSGPGTLDPPDGNKQTLEGATALQGNADQLAASDSTAGSSNGQHDDALKGSLGAVTGQQGDALKGKSTEGANGQKVNAWEASTPDAAIVAADSLGYDGLIELKRASHH